MGITLQHLIDIDEVFAKATDQAGFAGAVEQFKSRIDDIVVMRCDASDVLEEPYRSYDCFDLHLIDGSTHCPQVTTNPEGANGLLLAWRGTA